jgi:surface antigen
VKNLTVVWKSLILTATLGSLTACNSVPTQSASVYNPVVKGPGIEAGIATNIILNTYIGSVYGLDDTQKYQQTAAVHTALESEYGQIVSWYDRDAMGHVKSVHGYPQGRGYCKVIFSAVTVRGQTRQYEETACQNHYDSRGWRFVKK